MGAAKSVLAYLDEKPNKTRKADHGVYTIEGRKSMGDGMSSSWSNQDSYTWFEVGSPDDPFSTVQAYLVFDGHGPHGHLVSAKCADLLPKHLCDTKFNFHEAFELMQQDLEDGDFENCDASFSGSTCVAVVLDDEGRITVAGVGDSLAVLAMRQGHGVYSPSVLNLAHKPERPEERARIEAAGGQVYAYDPNAVGVDESLIPKRVWYRKNPDNAHSSSMTGLAMTRSLGDAMAHQAGVTCVPDIDCDCLDEGDDFIIVASDGVWDVLDAQSAVDKVQEYIIAYGHADGLLGWSPERASQYICEAARQRWEEFSPQTIDDITCIIIKLPERD